MDGHENKNETRKTLRGIRQSISEYIEISENQGEKENCHFENDKELKRTDTDNKLTS